MGASRGQSGNGKGGAHRVSASDVRDGEQISFLRPGAVPSLAVAPVGGSGEGCLARSPSTADAEAFVSPAGESPTRGAAMPLAARVRYSGGWLHHQLPVYSPLHLGMLVAAAWHVGRRGSDPRPALAAALRERYQADATILCGSGTDALQLGLRTALARARQPPVLALPAFSCFDVAAAAVANGARIAFYDIDPLTLGPDPESLEQALAAGAGVVVVSPLYGMPVAWDEIQAQCGRHGAVVVEDSAQGAMARWRGRLLGSMGEISIISFGRGKGWTGGQGGALLLRSRGAASSISVEGSEATNLRDEVHLLASSLVQALLGRPAIYRVPVSIPWLHLGKTRYHVSAPPREMTRIAAALVWASRLPAEAEAEHRRAAAADMLARIPVRAAVSPIRIPPHVQPGFLRLPLRLARGMSGFRDPALAKRLGIAPSYPLPLPELPQVQELRVHTGVRYPGARQLVHELVTLPIHSLVDDAQREQMLHLLDTYAA